MKNLKSLLLAGLFTVSIAGASWAAIETNSQTTATENVVTADFSKEKKKPCKKKDCKKACCSKEANAKSCCKKGAAKTCNKKASVEKTAE